MLLFYNAFIEFSVFFQPLIAELKQELPLLKNYLLRDKIHECDDLEIIGYNIIYSARCVGVVLIFVSSWFYSLYFGLAWSTYDRES